MTVIQRENQGRPAHREGGLRVSKAELSSEGRDHAAQLLGDLRGARGIQVEGHTDSDPIQAL
ncbi:MAG: hypothetical protein R3F30_12645 [Planctomycetota bacterium]